VAPWLEAPLSVAPNAPSHPPMWTALVAGIQFTGPVQYAQLPGPPDGVCVEVEGGRFASRPASAGTADGRLEVPGHTHRARVEAPVGRCPLPRTIRQARNGFRVFVVAQSGTSQITSATHVGANADGPGRAAKAGPGPSLRKTAAGSVRLGETPAKDSCAY
jgi:hypothetical protein